MKVKIIDFVEENKSKFKPYKNVEKLKVLEVSEINPNKNDFWGKKFLCENQNKHLVVKTDFELEYGYNQLKNGYLVPQKNIKLKAYKIIKKLEFNSTDGWSISLVPGDYIVIMKKIITGMKKEEFEENYLPYIKANKIVKKYEENENM